MKIVAMVLAACCLFAIPMAASSPITVGETLITNEYPETITFEVAAASSAGEITSVELNMMMRGGDSLQINPAEFEPGQQVTARYVWKTFRDGVPPGTPLQYTWTVREVEVLQLVAAGHSNREIAETLFISVPTVKRHLSTILRKLDLPSRPAAVAFAHTHGLA